MRSFFFLMLLISVVLIEIFLFIEVGTYLHVLIIFALIVCTALIGLLLAKKQSISAFSDLRHPGSANVNFTIQIIDGVGALGAGLLLLLPGFGTDFIGLLLLIPRLRKILLSFTLKCLFARSKSYSNQEDSSYNDRAGTIIEGQFKSSSSPVDDEGSKPLF